MSRPVRTLGAMALLLAVAGCAMAPKSSGVSLIDDEPAAGIQSASQPSAPERNQTASQAPPGVPATSNGSNAAATASSSQNTATTKAAHDPSELLALAQSLRQLSPAEQDQLIADLKQTDPQLWPLVTQQFKASLNYRQRQQTGGPSVSSAVALEPMTPAPVSPAETVNSSPGPASAPLVQQSVPSAVKTVSVNQTVTAATPVVTAAAPQTGPPSTPVPSDWRQPLSATIASVEQSLRESPGNDQRQIHLRLLHLIAGHRDQALELVPGREPAEQEFWSKELYALSTLWDVSRQPDEGKRRTEAAIHFDEANGKLRELGLLTIRNLAFCTEVSSYGVYKRFDKDEFRPEQRVLLYAELENFVSQATPQGYHTALKASYQIFDNRGATVEEQDLPPMEEFCQNPRRDFFVAYSDVRLPKQIYDGRYTLKLTIEDTLGKKIAQSSIEFTVKNQAASLATR